ncbi:hypothetical protein HGRIS_005965 [Hohenbuehelia grisea]|uniref:Uncharacterized protein n=1 Tax=Hohenbuehelia grisea TaxID=104357 RepID=A0ABR3K0D5_9AGAR
MSSDPGAGEDKAEKSLSFSSNLYLFTFLSTLIVLVLISGLIILRSFIIRRRINRSIQEALQQGILLPLNTPGGRGGKCKYVVQQRPKLYESWLADGGEMWDEMSPICAQVVKRKVQEEAPEKKPFVAPGPRSRHLGFLARWRVSPFVSAPQAPVDHDEMPVRPPGRSHRPNPDRELAKALADAKMLSPGVSRSPSTSDVLQIAVFIAMPSPTASRRVQGGRESVASSVEEADVDAEIPELAVGVRRFTMLRGSSRPSSLT